MSIANKLVPISIVDLTGGVTTSSLNTLILLCGGVKPAAYGTAVSKAYGDLESVKEDWTEASSAYKKAKAFFSQNQFPSTLNIAAYGDEATYAAIETALLGAITEGREFYHIIVDVEDTSVIDDLGDWAVSSKKLVHFDTDDIDTLNSSVSTDPFSVLNGLETKRIAGYFVGDEDESLATAIVASRCGLDSVRGTFAHKEVNGVASLSATDTQYLSVKEKNANAYFKISSTDNRLLFGTTTDGDFIDRLEKIDWVEANIRTALLNLLKNADSGNGLPFDDDGFQSIKAAITSVLSTACDQNHKYILDSYSVSVPNYSELTSEQKTNRKVPYCTYTFTPRASGHEFEAVTGYIVA